MTQFRDNLCHQLQLDQQLGYKEAMNIVNQLFPDKNFFAFKMFTKKSDASKMEKEISEIQRINDEAIKHGSYRITNS